MEPAPGSTARWSRTSSTPSSRGDTFSQPGLFQVTIAKVELDQKLFRPGHTVDIQAQGAQARPGRPRHDDLGRQGIWVPARRRRQGRPDRGHGPTGRFRSSGTPAISSSSKFMTPGRASSSSPGDLPSRWPIRSATEFPLKSGDFPLRAGPERRFAGQPAHQPRRPAKPASGRSPLARPRGPTQVAERPIVIK